MQNSTMLLGSFCLILAALCVSDAFATYGETIQLGLSDDSAHSFTIGKSTYEISRIKVDWYLAKIGCSLKGMDLLSIETEEEQSEIEAAIERYNESMWISGGNNDLDKNFYWESTGHAFGPYLNWAPAEPDNGAAGNKASQHCVILNHTNGYMWHDEDCTASELRFICESKDFNSDQNRPRFGFEDSMYEVSALKLNWWNSKYDCSSRGMALVSVETESEKIAILQGISSYNKSDAFWISASDIGLENSFYWDSDGKFLGLHTDWAENQPDNANGIEHCVNLGINTNETYRWSDIDCRATRRYLCEDKQNGLRKSDQKNLLSDALTGDQYENEFNEEKANRFAYGNSTYEISTSTADWYLAKINCRLEGMELVSIETREEQEAITAKISATDGNFWTSGNDDMGPLFMWDSTGQTVGSYWNWASGQPDNGAAINLSPQNCMVLNSTDNYKWYDYGCQSEQMRYICEKKTSREDEVTKFSYFGFSNYEVSGLHVNWWMANRDCRSRGMQLVSIESKEENDAIINGMKAFNLTTSFWTAATDLGHQGNFYWDSTGDFLAVHSDWGVGEPSIDDGSEHCVLLVNGPLSDGKFHWGDEPCYIRNRYVCENNLTSFNNY